MGRHTFLALAAILVATCSDPRASERAAAARLHAAAAEAALGKGDWARALMAAEHAVAYDPLDAAARDLLYRVRLTAVAVSPTSIPLEKPQEVDYEAEAMISRDPARAFVYRTARAYFAMARGDDASAEALLNQAVSQNPGWAASSLALARMYRRQQRVPQAIRALESILERDSNSQPALLGLGDLLTTSKEGARAEVLLRKALALSDGAAVRVALANAVWDGPRHAEAGDHLRRAIALEPQSPEAHRRLGEFLFAASDLQGAAREFEEASRLGAGPLATFGAALVLEAQNSPGDAGRAFAAAFNADPRLAIAAYRGALAHQRAGNLGEAIDLLTRFLKTNLADDRQRADAEARLGDLLEAHALQRQPPQVAKPSFAPPDFLRQEARPARVGPFRPGAD
jgi:tetratricopeptide (TPR) repeat protein